LPLTATSNEIAEALQRASEAYCESLLQTEARIIAENDDAIVLAVRIPKQTILQNHALLLALSDASAR
jgi:hypothetical protein